MDFLTLCQYVADNSDNTRPETVYNASLGQLTRKVRRFRNHVNSAYLLIKHWLGIRNEYIETSQAFTITGGSETTAIPSNILEVLSIQVGNDLPIRIIPWSEFERYKSDTLTVSISGSPDVASIFGRNLYFFPSPDTSYSATLKGMATWEALDLDADVPVLGEEFHPVIAELALYFELQYCNDPQSGLLATSPSGTVAGQGGQAAKAMAMFYAAKNNIANHMVDIPRIISRREMARYNASRRITRA